MRLVCWNVNGLRTLKGYVPWYSLSSWEACLNELGADIACLQEVKMTRKQLTVHLCVMDDYEAFYDLHPIKGYSGTATYVKRAVCLPSKAQFGITGEMHANDDLGALPQTFRSTLDPQLCAALDNEGRCVILDCNLFILINVYAPNETDEGRAEYKYVSNTNTEWRFIVC